MLKYDGKWNKNINFNFIYYLIELLQFKSRFFTSGAGYSETVIKLENENFWNFAGWKLDMWLENPR